MNLLDQVSRDIAKIEGRGLGSIDDLNLLTNLLLCEYHLTARMKKPDTEDGHSKSSASTSNRVVDRDINALFANYQQIREEYRKNMSDDCKNKLLTSLEALTSELYDMIYVINCSAMINDEREIISSFSEKINCI